MTIFPEGILGFIEFLNVKENTVFGPVEISPWHRASGRIEKNKITTSKRLSKITGKIINQATGGGLLVTVS
jgi:hypothetical protein